ncbi:MAG: hypothetical protein QOJ26_999 [Thermoplasmata archaeon]|jgi:signal transduction histidine kinase|nr:hypothetical protein [Thermoplasmata archaeon]MEA3166130.1 hypothetical protein [Thermoplasmata archaeon]
MSPTHEPLHVLPHDTLDVLLLEDSDWDSKTAQEALVGTGQPFAVERVVRLSDARKRLGERAFDVVLCDLNVPDSRGLSTLQAVLAAVPSGTAVVAFTGEGDVEMGRRALAAGAQDFVQKGIEGFVGLRRSLEFAVERHRLAAALALAKEVGDRADFLEKQDRSRALFMNVVAHELNNPLTPLRLQVALLRHPGATPLTPKQEASVATMSRNIERLAGLVADLLDISRMGTGKFRMQSRKADLAEVCREVVANYAPLAASKKVTIAAAAPDPAIAGFDAARITQVLLNLVSNAVKFTPRGGHVVVSCSVVGDEVVVAVHDTGRGLEPSQIARLFRPFEQLQDAATGSLQGGMGLGLYICKGIIDAHEGRIWAASEGAGRGATMTFTIPVTPGNAGVVPEPELPDVPDLPVKPVVIRPIKPRIPYTAPPVDGLPSNGP